MIATSETLATFARMLTIAGFDKERPDPLLAWRVFKDFAEIPVECAEDGLLFQCGTFSFIVPRWRRFSRGWRRWTNFRSRRAALLLCVLRSTKKTSRIGWLTNC